MNTHETNQGSLQETSIHRVWETNTLNDLSLFTPESDIQALIYNGRFEQLRGVDQKDLDQLAQTLASSGGIGAAEHVTSESLRDLFEEIRKELEDYIGDNVTLLKSLDAIFNHVQDVERHLSQEWEITRFELRALDAEKSGVHPKGLHQDTGVALYVDENRDMNVSITYVGHSTSISPDKKGSKLEGGEPRAITMWRTGKTDIYHGDINKHRQVDPLRLIVILSMTPRR